MKRSTATGRNKKFVIIIFTCACRVLLEVLSYSRNEVSALKLLIGLQERANVLRS